MASSVASTGTFWEGQPQTLPIGMEPKPRPSRPSRVTTSTATCKSTASVTTRPPNLIGAR